MVELTVYLKHGGSTSALIDAIVDPSSKRCEGKRRVVLADVFTKLPCFWCRCREEALGWVWCGKPYAPVTAAHPKQRVAIGAFGLLNTFTKSTKQMMFSKHQTLTRFPCGSRSTGTKTVDDMFRVCTCGHSIQLYVTVGMMEPYIEYYIGWNSSFIQRVALNEKVK